MQNIYTDSTYLQNNPTWHEEDAPMKTQYILQLLKRHPIQLKTICEAGCGSGAILQNLQNELPKETQFWGYDISPDAIAIAQQKTNAQLQFQLLDITQANTQKFDLLLVIDVLEHLENYFIFLQSIQTKSTYTLFHIPLDMSLWSLFREKMLIESKQKVGHMHNFTEDFVKSILQDYGFEIVDSIYTPPTFEKMNAKQKIVNGFRKFLFALNKRFASKILGGYSIMVLTHNK
jgi:predicted TPR repeat methyltransferase